MLLERTGTAFVSSNRQAIYPEVGFTCNGILHQFVFGASSINKQMDQHPMLQIWRPVGDTTYLLVSQSTLELTSFSRGLHEYDLPSNTTFQAGDVIGYYQPNTMMSQFRLMVEGNGYQCSYLTYEPNNLSSILDARDSQMQCGHTTLFHPITGLLGYSP